MKINNLWRSLISSSSFWWKKWKNCLRSTNRSNVFVFFTKNLRLKTKNSFPTKSFLRQPIAMHFRWDPKLPTDSVTKTTFVGHFLKKILQVRRVFIEIDVVSLIFFCRFIVRGHRINTIYFDFDSFPVENVETIRKKIVSVVEQTGRVYRKNFQFERFWRIFGKFRWNSSVKIFVFRFEITEKIDLSSIRFDEEIQFDFVRIFSRIFQRKLFFVNISIFERILFHRGFSSIDSICFQMFNWQRKRFSRRKIFSKKPNLSFD